MRGPYRLLQVKQLRQCLRFRGLKQVGSKGELVQRLDASDAAGWRVDHLKYLARDAEPHRAPAAGKVGRGRPCADDVSIPCVCKAV